MKIEHESIFASSLRAFFVSFFAVIGIGVSITLIALGFYGLTSLAEEETFSSDVKLLPDAKGSRKELSASTPVLLQLNLKGEIGKSDLTAEKIEKVLLKSHEDHLKNNRVKGILLYIDSPGGGVNDSDQIYRLLLRYKEEYHVPIFAYIDGLCASGGYYVACAADKIFASDVSLIGSIGVLAWPPFINVAEALEKLGVNSLTLFAGKGKDELNPLRPWKEGEQDTYQKLINFYYTRFTEIVSKKRPELTAERLVQVYGATVFPAPEAKEIGFIDAFGHFRSDVLTELATAAGIPADEKYQVITYETKGWFEKLIKEESFWRTGKVQHELLLPSSLTMEGRGHFQYLYSP